jgi:hypothetical protein
VFIGVVFHVRAKERCEKCSIRGTGFVLNEYFAQTGEPRGMKKTNHWFEVHTKHLTLWVLMFFVVSESESRSSEIRILEAGMHRFI